MIELNNLTIRYEQTILDHITYTFPDTGLIGIQGASGCGKSTLLYCISGLSNYAGSILFNGQEIDQSFCRLIGFIKQNNDLIPSFTVEENILSGCYFGQIAYDHKKYNRIVKRLKIDKLLKRYPDELSIGQMKRVSIARALLKEAPVLLCDEPTGALHYKQAKEVMELLKEVSQNRLVIIVSHDQELLGKYADTLIELNNHTLHILKENNSSKEVIVPALKKHINLRYSFKEVLAQRNRLYLLSLFQCLIIVSSFMIMSAIGGLSQSIEKSYQQAPLKNIVTLSSHEGEPLPLKENTFMTPHFDIERGYVKGINASMIRLPRDTSHIKLISGHFPRTSEEVLITNNVSKKLSSPFTFTLQEKMQCKVVGIIEDDFYQDKMICFYHDIDQEYPKLLRDDKMDIETTHVDTVIKRYEKKYEADNDVYMKKMSYGTLILIGKIIGAIYIMMSMIVAIELTKIVFSSLYLERSRTLALKISMGASFNKLRKDSYIEIFFIGTFTYILSMLLFYMILSLLSFSSFYHYFHFNCLPLSFIYYIIYYLGYMFILIISASRPFLRIKKESILSLLREE